MFKIVFQTVVLVAVAGHAVEVLADPPVTTGLFLNLNADSTSNFVLNGSNVNVWKDSATDGSDGTVQSYGQATANNQPSLTTASMPNGRTMNVVGFTRGTVTGSNNSTTSSDFLVSNLTGSNGAFTAGADNAYVIGGSTTNPNGESYFAVFHFNIASTAAGSAQQSQTIWSDRHLNGPGTAGGIFTTNNNVGNTSVPDLYTSVRVGDSPTYTQSYYGFGDTTTTAWFIAATSWDMDSGNATTRVLRSDGVDSGNQLMSPNASWTTALTASDYAILGTNQKVLGTNKTAFDGQMAEVLMYNTALNSTDFSSVINYLSTKYFALPGDYNGDHIVDAADYVVWRKDPTNPLYGGDPDGYNTWRANFGTGSPGAGAGLGSQEVPEPTTVLLVASALAIAYLGARASRRGNGVSLKKCCSNG